MRRVSKNTFTAALCNFYSVACKPTFRMRNYAWTDRDGRFGLLPGGSDTHRQHGPFPCRVVRRGDCSSKPRVSSLRHKDAAVFLRCRTDSRRSVALITGLVSSWMTATATWPRNCSTEYRSLKGRDSHEGVWESRLSLLTAAEAAESQASSFHHIAI